MTNSYSQYFREDIKPTTPRHINTLDTGAIVKVVSLPDVRNWEFGKWLLGDFRVGDICRILDKTKGNEQRGWDIECFNEDLSGSRVLRVLPELGPLFCIVEDSTIKLPPMKTPELMQ